MKAHESHVTTDRAEIQRWAEERGGVPVSVSSTERDSGAGVLRIDFPGHGTDEGFRKLSWDEFFRKFDEQELAFVYQEETSDGSESRFCKFVSRDNV